MYAEIRPFSTFYLTFRSYGIDVDLRAFPYNHFVRFYEEISIKIDFNSILLENVFLKTISDYHLYGMRSGRMCL